MGDLEWAISPEPVEIGPRCLSYAPVAGMAGFLVEVDAMIRGLFRLIGLLLLAGGFVFLIYDGARSIADQALRLTRLGEFWNDVHQASQASFRAVMEANAPSLWPLVRLILDQPVWAVMGVIGLLLMLLFRPRKPLIGYSRN